MKDINQRILKCPSKSQLMGTIVGLVCQGRSHCISKLTQLFPFLQYTLINSSVLTIVGVPTFDLDQTFMSDPVDIEF